MRHYPHLGSASFWLNQISHAARPIRSTQIWVVTRHQNGISALVSQMSFGRKPVVASPNVGCFLRLNIKALSIKKLSFTKMYAFSPAFQAHVTSVLCKSTFSQESRCRVTSNRRDFVWDFCVTRDWEACGLLGLFIRSDTPSCACAAWSFQRIVRKDYPKQIGTHCGVSCVVCGTVM